MDRSMIIHKKIIENFINSIPSLFKYSNQPYGVSLEILDADGLDNPKIIKITNVTNHGMDLFFNFFHKLNFKFDKEFKTKRYFDDYYIKDHDLKLAEEEYEIFLKVYDQEIKVALAINMMSQAVSEQSKKS
tara:strand:- start:6412 stop:6804 length:393 start_codon:yes stop_codon:yes gene_type:complete